MNEFKFFVESKADIKFLKDFINAKFNISLNGSFFDTLGAWSGYKAGGNLKASIVENYDNQRKTILILDADNDLINRRNEVTSDFVKYNTPLRLFLFPNDISTGNLESLLAQIAYDRKAIDCFLEFERCVSGYPKPLNHSRIYAYLDLLLHPNQVVNNIDMRKDEFRDYRNKKHWDLENIALQPLCDFLKNECGF